MSASETRTAGRIRMSKGVMLLSGPVVGLVYATVMPFLALMTVTVLIGRRALGGVYDLAAKTASFGWSPNSAYLSGKRHRL